MSKDIRVTGREKQVLRLITEGLTNKEIAGVLKISRHTVARHLQKTFSKLQVADRFEAVEEAKRREII